MSTRSCAIIRSSDDLTNTGRARSADTLCTLYRHCDGYPAIGGRVLAELAESSSSAETLLSRLLMQATIDYDGREHRTYELTSSADDHGDIEHVYVVTRTVRRDPKSLRASHVWIFEHAIRPGWVAGSEEWQSWPRTEYSAEEFDAFTLKELDLLRLRIEQHRNAQKGSAEA